MSATLAIPTTAPRVSTVQREFDELVRGHLPRLRVHAMSLCRPRTHLDPEDLLQDALVRAFHAFDSLRDRDFVRPWLVKILSHTFIDALRKQRSRPQMVPLDPALDVVADGEATEPLAWERIDPEQHRAAIERLPDDMRDTYWMFAVEGMDYAAIAAALGIPKPTVGTRIMRARKKLRELLSADAKEAP
jgi:RNA polymerase sigma-70 factor, ECF subfamily